MTNWTAPDWDPADPDAYRPLPSDEQAIEDGYVYDPARAKVVRDFIETLCLQRRPPFRNKPLALMDWQRTHLINPAFGWVHSETGVRRFRRWSVWTPKKCGKTQSFCAIALYLTIEAEATETYWIATTAEQAKKTLYRDLVHMATAHPAFKNRFWCRDHLKEVLDREGDSYVKILPAKAETADGYNGNVLLDEFAALSPEKASELWGKVKYANAARPNGVVATISTAQHNRSSIAYDHFVEARKAEREAGQNPRLLPVVFALDEEAGEEWTDPKVWERVNPSAGVTFPLEQLAEAYEEDKETPKGEHDFRCLRLNQWAGSADRWLTASAWDACKSETPEEELLALIETGEAEAAVGVDWGRAYDLAAIVVCVRHGRKVHVVDPQFFLPEGLVEQRSKKDGIAYRTLVDAGHIEATPGDVVDCETFREAVFSAAEKWQTDLVAFDPAGFESDRQQLEESGLECVSISSGWQVIGPASNRFEDLILAGELRQPAHPLLDVCVNNAKVKDSPLGDWVRPIKTRDGNKIDGVMATIHALALLFKGEEEQPETFTPIMVD